MGARHPGRQLHSQHGCGGVQGGISRCFGPQAAGQGWPFYDYCTSSGLRQTAVSFDQLHEAFNSYNEVATAVGLIWLHRSNVVFPDVYFQFYSKHFTIMGLLDLEIRFGTADEFVGGYLVHRHVASSGRKAHAMLPPSYVQGAKCPRPSPTYTYRLGGTRTPGQHPPIHVIFMAAIGRVLPSPSRFCMVEAPAKEWSFNDALVPWILLAGYRNPNETVPDFPDDENEAGGSLHKGSGSMPLTSASAEVTAVDGAEEEDNGFETVDDREGEPGDRVVILIPAEKVAKPEASGLAGKTLLFESEEEDDPEVKKQIEAALDKMGLLGDLMLSEHKDKSESESSDDDDDDDDLNETKQYYEDQEEGIGESGSKLSNPKAVNTHPAAVPESARNPTGSKPEAPSGNTPLPNPGAPRARVPAVSVLAKLLLPNYNFRPWPKGYNSARSPLSSVRPPWHRLHERKRIPSAAWKTIPVF